MKFTTRTLSMVAAIVLCAAMTIGGTLAYLTDTDGIMNEFTIGEVDIKLNEHYVQKSVLMPGVDTSKTASIKNVGKNDAYVIMSVAVPAADEKPFVTANMTTSGWTLKNETKSLTIDGATYYLYVYMYDQILAAGAETSQLLNSITLDKNVDFDPNTGKYALVVNGETTPINTDLTAGKVYVNAYAIQTNGFADSEEAYTAYAAQWGAWSEDQILAGVKDNTQDDTTKLEAKTAAEFKAAIEQASASGAGDSVINLAKGEYDMTDLTESIEVKGYTGADVITINGNGSVLTNLKVPLFSGGFAGGSGIVINDLTIKGSAVVSSNSQGSGAFIECVDSMDIITLNNCHLIDSTLSGSRTGGLIGWTSGYNNTNDGAVYTNVTVKNCSVVGCTINGSNESVGAINGHAGANPWTKTVIENCTVKNNILNGGSGKTGVILGTANVGEVIINSCTMDNNTVNGATSTQAYGRTVFGTTGSLTIDGVAIQ